MQTFLGLPKMALDDMRSGQIVLVSAAHCTPYKHDQPSHSASAPAAIRAASAKFADWRDHYDFDTGQPLLPAGVDVVDAGELGCAADDPAGNRGLIHDAVRRVLDVGAHPVVLGGDDSVPIPVLSAYQDHGPIWIVQVDAHIDWRDERFGESLGWSSTMRRASEMPWVEGIVQVGIRGVGSATPEEVGFARKWGASIVTARQVFADGVAAHLSAVPQDANIFVTLDCDALDPSVLPGVNAPAPGGLVFWQLIDLFETVAGRGRVVGFDIVELVPERDQTGLSNLTAVRLTSLAIAAMAAGAR